jgi:hypothetical protein
LTASTARPITHIIIIIIIISSLITGESEKRIFFLCKRRTNFDFGVIENIALEA